MKKHFRKEEVLDYIKDRGVCSVEELQTSFAVSISTIHRDLNILEREGRVNKFYGKVTIKDESVLYRSRIRVNVELKRRVAQKALDYIENGDCLFIDNSTTTYYLAEVLCESSFQDILVVSNSALVIDLFLKNKSIGFVSTGGKLNKDFDSFVGPQALRTINDFNGNKYLPDEIAVKNRMYRNARESYLLIDSTKFGQVSTMKWFELKDVRNVVTDNKVPNDILQEFRDLGLNMIVA